MRKIVLVLGLLLLLTTIAYSDDAQQRREKDRERLFEISKEVEFKTFLPKDKNEGFCKIFLNDLRQKKDIEFADPIVETDDYNDPKLQSYLGKCPKLELNKEVTLDPGRLRNMWEALEKMPEKEREKYGDVWYANLDFRLYQVDFDSNPKNGEEYLYYRGGWYAPLTKEGGSGGSYTVVDFNNCKRLGERNASGPINYPTRQPTKNFNGILRYKNVHYIYEVSFSPVDYGVSLYKWDKNIKGNTIGVCYFHGKQQPTTGGAK